MRRSRSVHQMKSLQSSDSKNPFGLGWMINRPFFMGQLASNETFGHTGFTGTSILMNARLSLATVLLTNRVCPTRNGPDINPYRRKIADTLSNLLQ